MHKLPFDTVNLNESEVDTLADVYDTLRAKYHVTVPDFDLDLTRFDLITCNNDPNRHSDISFGGVLQINNTPNECYVIFVKKRWYTTNRAYSGEGFDYNGYMAWALVKQNKDFGRVLIRRETLTDKIVGLIHPVQMQFEDDKAFSKKFFVATNDEQKAAAAMSWNFRNALMDTNREDILIEAVNDMLLIGNNQALDTKELVTWAEIAVKIASLR